MSETNNERVTIVSSYPRGGATAVMRMLDFGGMPIFPCDPISYDTSTETRAYKDSLVWLERARGMAVKVLDGPSRKFPTDLGMDFIWVVRDPFEQAKSEMKFRTEVLKEKVQAGAISARADQIQRRRRRDGELLGSYRGARVLVLRFEVVIKQPLIAANAISEFLEGAALVPFDATWAAEAILDRSPWCFPGFFEERLIEEYGRVNHEGHEDADAERS